MEVKAIQIGKKKVKISLFADDMIVYLYNPKTSTREHLNLMNNFSKVAGYKIISSKLVAFLYSKNKQDKKEVRKMTPFSIVQIDASTKGKKEEGRREWAREKGL